jgi:hypothetical protein
MGILASVYPFFALNPSTPVLASFQEEKDVDVKKMD